MLRFKNPPHSPWRHREIIPALWTRDHPCPDRQSCARNCRAGSGVSSSPQTGSLANLFPPTIGAAASGRGVEFPPFLSRAGLLGHFAPFWVARGPFSSSSGRRGQRGIMAPMGEMKRRLLAGRLEGFWWNGSTSALQSKSTIFSPAACADRAHRPTVRPTLWNGKPTPETPFSRQRQAEGAQAA